MSLRLVLFFSSLFILLNTVVVRAEQVVIHTMPRSVADKICKALSEDRQACQAGDEVHFVSSFKLDNNQLLLFYFYKKHKAKGASANSSNSYSNYPEGVTLPIRLDEHAKWHIGSAFVGEPRAIVRDQQGNLWMHAQFDSKAATPRLLYSKNGMQWLDIDLPDDRHPAYQYEHIKTLCLYHDSMLVALQDAATTTLWRTKLANLLAAVIENTKPRWSSLPGSQVNTASCQSRKAKNNDWQIQQGETLTLLILEDKGLTIKLPRRTVIKTVNSTSTSGDKSKRVKLSADNADKITGKTSTKNQHTVLNRKSQEQARGRNSRADTDTASNQPTKPQNAGATIKPAKRVKSAGDYAIQVGAFSHHAAVATRLGKLQKAGYKTFTRVLDIQGKSIKKLYVGPYASRKQAEAALQQLVKEWENDANSRPFIVKFR